MLEFRFEGGVVDPEDLPVEGNAVLDPQPAHDLDHLQDRLVFAVRVDPGRPQLAAVTGPEAGDDAPAGEVGEGQVLLGDPDRMAHRDHHPRPDDQPFHQGSQPDQGGERLEEGHVGVFLVAVRMPQEVIAGPHRVEAQVLYELDPLDQAGPGGVGTEVGQ